MVDDLALLIRLAHRRVTAAIADALRPFDVEDRHVGVLRTLRRLGPLSQRQLIDALGSDKSAMVRTVDDLERQGFAWRAPAAGDRRAYAVELTPAGRDLLADAERIVDRVGAELLAGLSPAERDTLRELLRRFVTRRTADETPEAPGPPDGVPGPPPEPAYAPPHRTRRARAAAARLTDVDEPDSPDSRRRLAR